MAMKFNGAVSSLAVVCMVAMGFSLSFPHAAEAAFSCQQVMSHLAPCLTYLEGGSDAPAFSCCDGVRAVNDAAGTTSDRQDACRCLKSIAGSIPAIKPDNAANLPSLCSVNVPYPISFATDCDNTTEEDDSSRRNSDDDTKEFKSKNLKAERKRRKKLSDRLLELRSLCPNITNMNKATIITDAITCIQNLQNTVEELSDELHSIDALLKEEMIPCKNEVKIHGAELEMKECGLQTEVQVTHLYGNKLWIQIICQKKNGALTKLIEAITVLGFHPQDTSVTTIKGGLLVTLCVEAYHGGFIEVAKIRDFLMDTVRNMKSSSERLNKFIQNASPAEVSFFIGNAQAAARRLQFSWPPLSSPSASPAPSEEGGFVDPADPVLLTHVRSRHHSLNGSMACGDMILGGFATALIASIYCYIRITRKYHQPHS
ncbi:OLC1v1021837C1 [Oldenlandia corymbosa var. corymbosa]|uniref:Non-specific lipid-transfer protein n=1 Tax=Oldenlandia corymbosa var. corymbosa TaxID=529605 RepID=A0AAV1BWS0_OLDCO|nr:OLC1v1021837C1 [Oldenlandia corymbosa var. corymbosa]